MTDPRARYASVLGAESILSILELVVPKSC